MKKAFLAASASMSVLALCATSANAQTNQLEEVVVTAQRFSESTQKASIIVSVITPEQLQGVTEIRQLQTIEPGVQLGTAGGTVQTYIRGAGSVNTQATQGTSVAYNIDGAALFTPTMLSPYLYDLARIEMLKGPQGTLYGRNASAGAVNVITEGASLGGVSGYVEGELGNYDLRRVVAAVNVPLSDQLAIRLAAQHVEHEGYLSDGSDDQDITAARVRLRWEPTSKVTLQAGFDVSKTDQIGPGGSINPNPTGDDFVGGRDPRLPQPTPGNFPNFGMAVLPPYDPYYKDDQWSAQAQLDVDLGFATLTVLPAYRYENLSYQEYAPGFQDTQSPEIKQSSIEARLSNQTDKFRWVLGAYYFDLTADAPAHIRNDANRQNAMVGITYDTEAYAVFGEGTYNLTDRFRVIAGLRYSSEETSSRGASNALNGPPNLPQQSPLYNPFNPITNPTGDLLDYPIANNSKADATTWRFGVEFDLAEDSMLFATASKGFKGGGTYVDIPGQPQSFRPEFMTAYEIGSRNRFLGDALQVNGGVFLWKLEDQQVPYLGFNSVGQVTYLTANAGSAEMYGANLDVTWRATSNDTLRVSTEYNHSEYESFSRVIPDLGIMRPTACRVTSRGAPAPGQLPSSVVDCAGLQVVRAPDWTGLVSYQHRFDLGEAGELTADVNATYTSSRYVDLTYTSLVHQKANTMWNASLTYALPSQDLTVTGWVRNITDDRVFAGGGHVIPGYARPALQPPRTYGVSVRKAF